MTENNNARHKAITAWVEDRDEDPKTLVLSLQDYVEDLEYELQDLDDAADD